MDSPAAVWIPRCPVPLQNLTFSIRKCVGSPQRDKVEWNRILPFFDSHQKVTVKSTKTTKQNSKDNEAVWKIWWESCVLEKWGAEGSLVAWQSRRTSSPSQRRQPRPPPDRCQSHRCVRARATVVPLRKAGRSRTGQQALAPQSPL